MVGWIDLGLVPKRNCEGGLLWRLAANLKQFLEEMRLFQEILERVMGLDDSDLTQHLSCGVKLDQELIYEETTVVLKYKVK